MRISRVRAAYVAAAAAVALGTAPLLTAASATVPATTTEQARTAPDKGKNVLRAGAARIDISPAADPEFPALDEYDHEKLFVRAIVFENKGKRAALIGADLSGIADPVWQDAVKRVAGELKTPVENVIISSTHTHSDRPPGTVENPGGGRYGQDFVGDVMVRAVKDASSKMEPALMGYGSGDAYLNVNRDTINPATKKWTQAANLDAVTDTELAVLSFVRPDGSPIAAYLSYAMHPVNAYLAAHTTGDFPAATSRYIEKAFGDEMVAVYNQGAAGDQNPRSLRAGTNMLASRSGAEITGYELVREDIEAPLRSRPGRPADTQVLRDLFRYIDSLGVVLGEEAIRVMSTTTEHTATPEIWGTADSVTCPGRTRLDDAREGVPGEYTDGPDVTLRTGLLGIGDVALTTVNAEIYTKIGLRVKEESPLTKTMVVTVSGGHAPSSYVLDNESEYHQTFQALTSKLQPGCAENGLVQSVTGLVEQYADQSR
ncbi:Neutral/alkaline non-lysosomal ceramidase, N-terminal [Promicromonospora umidemergens]|uniref:Neutral/alkaline non-lysosomal ceramidase N-terminal domain-containing protein n=1 Tax=Promicromonospora umidemergens TaxID=629679 RepID=A0ABP8Y0R2_9MICO|nr:neutral/alkaline non-lysosomal ceramidase N-terminal domain-containing protein [Promicromonospora umidemergens]MCP2284176.1 Neutral/alkaline non-lysosomal ceramidase, N-terminal [Promicromonospora umidemergens]